MTRSNGHNKDVTSVSLDAEIIDRAQRSEHINLSGLCNDLLKEYFETESRTKARLEAKRDRLLQEREHLKTELNHVEEELQELEQQLEQVQAAERKKREKIAELANTLPSRIDEDNPAVMNWAGKLDMTPAQLVEAIQDERGVSTN